MKGCRICCWIACVLRIQLLWIHTLTARHCWDPARMGQVHCLLSVQLFFMRHYTKTIMTNGMSDKVTKGTVGSNSSLSYNPISNTEYLHNDSLCLRVKQAAVYSTLLLFKTPSWQDPRNVSKFVCEFTLSEFSKRKQFNNIFCSPPFYTHQHGYKMRLVVFANGSSSGQNTHISVYVKLMTGDNDDQLQWPFVGDVKFMLLNWREDKRHFMRTLSINAASRFIQVLQGDHGQCRGYPQFISKFSLPYNRSTNTEYLQDDCLRFRASMVNEWLSCMFLVFDCIILFWWIAILVNFKNNVSCYFTKI